MPFVRLLLALCFTCLLAAPQAMAENETAALTKAMQQRYETLTSFTATFKQNLKNASSGQTELRKGTLAYRQPGLVRWETKTPEPELLIIGKNTVWSYFELEESAYKYTVDQVLSSKTVLKFLSGKARLEEDFYVSFTGRENGLNKLELIPKQPETEMVQAYLWLTDEQALLQKVQVIDFFGNENTVELNAVVMNVDMPDSLFSFTPPKGTDIYDNTNAQ